MFAKLNLELERNYISQMCLTNEPSIDRSSTLFVMRHTIIACQQQMAVPLRVVCNCCNEYQHCRLSIDAQA